MTKSGGLVDAALQPALTRLLNEPAGAEAAALLPLVYDQLRRIAAGRMRQQSPQHTLQATALVHEAYARLVTADEAPRRWAGQRHFYAAAAEAMRCILIDSARRKARLKHGGAAPRKRERVVLDELPATVADPPDDLIALDAALTALAEAHPEKAELVRLRYFAGLTIDEAARTLDISTATAERRWAFSRAWLYKRMGGGEGRR